MMDHGSFTRRFREEPEIGRDITDTQLTAYRDNGVEVDVWHENRRTTVGNGKILGLQEAEMARYWNAPHRARSR